MSTTAALAIAQSQMLGSLMWHRTVDLMQYLGRIDIPIEQSNASDQRGVGRTMRNEDHRDQHGNKKLWMTSSSGRGGRGSSGSRNESQTSR